MTEAKPSSAADGSGGASGSDGLAMTEPRASSSIDGGGLRGSDGVAVGRPGAPLVFIGAEAHVQDATVLGRPCIAKRRVDKTYRHPKLDARLRDERTRDEANLLMRCREAGVPVPVVYDMDRARGVIRMERIEGRALRDVLPEDDTHQAAARLRALGVLVGRMHAAGVTHGDLTTSNVMVTPAGGLVLIDLGLGQFTEEEEPRGVDIHLVEEALEATDARVEALVAAFLEGYRTWPGADGPLRRLEAIRLRGRYREAT